MTIDITRDIKIRTIILFEEYNRLYGQSENSTLHQYALPELTDIPNEIIDANMIYLIDERLVRGVVEQAGPNSFPSITRINSTGMRLVEQLVEKSAQEIPEVNESLKDIVTIKERATKYVTNCLSNPALTIKIIELAKDFFS